MYISCVIILGIKKKKKGPDCNMTCISYAGKYREFHKLYSEGEYHAAGDLLLALLQARLAPKQSVLSLLAAYHNINKKNFIANSNGFG